MEQGSHDELVWQFIREIYQVATWQEFLERIART